MRGLEAALAVYGEVRGGAFASEALRKVYQEIAPGDRKLAATLLYCTLRRQSLWKTMLIKYCKRGPRELPPLTWNALMIGIAGIVELRHFALPVLINGLVQAVKAGGGQKDVGLVNAVLHTVSDEYPRFLESLKKAARCATRRSTGAFPAGPPRSGRRSSPYRRPRSSSERAG